MVKTSDPVLPMIHPHLRLPTNKLEVVGNAGAKRQLIKGSLISL